MSYNSFPIPKFNVGDGLRVDSKNEVSADIASTEKLGSVIVGDGLSVDEDGVLSANSVKITYMTSVDDYLNFVFKTGHIYKIYYAFSVTFSGTVYPELGLHSQTNKIIFSTLAQTTSNSYCAGVVTLILKSNYNIAVDTAGRGTALDTGGLSGYTKSYLSNHEDTNYSTTATGFADNTIRVFDIYIEEY